MATQPYNRDSYGLSEPIISVQQAPIISIRNPTGSDKAQVGTEWVNTATNSAWILTSIEHNVAEWANITIGNSGIQQIDTDSGDALPVAGVININGSGITSTSGTGNTVIINTPITTYVTSSGNAQPLSNSISFIGSGDVTTTGSGSIVTIGGLGITTVHTGSGDATVSSNAITVAGGTGITTSGSGSTVTVAASGALAATFAADTGSATPSAGTITMHGSGDIATSATSHTVTFTGSGVTTVHSGSGDATVSSNAITIAGGTGITTTATGSTVTITASGGSGIVTLDGNSGSATGSTVTITTGGSDVQGTALFTGSGSTLTMTFTDSNKNTGIGTDVMNGLAPIGTENTALGYLAAANLLEAEDGVFIGSHAGFGATPSVGNETVSCVAVGSYSLYTATSDEFNTTVGDHSMFSASGSSSNTTIGYESLNQLVGGGFNAGLGYRAGFAYTGSESSNICINSQGTASESNTLHIGISTGTGTQQLNAAHICGIQTIVVTGTPVLVSTSDQLGVASSSQRFKNDIQSMNQESSAIHKLRPVTFVWNRDSSPGLKNAPQVRQSGLIAEEVHKVMPNLVNLDKDGKPFTVKYEELPSLLLNEIQKLNKRIEALESK